MKNSMCGSCPDARHWVAFLDGKKMDRCVWVKPGDPGHMLIVLQGGKGYVLHRGRVTLVTSAHFQESSDEHPVH